MIKFAVSIIKPPNHPHQALIEMGKTVYYGLIELGYDCVFTSNLDLENRQYIILGANLLYIHPLKIPQNSIIYNLEQIYADSPWLKAGYIDYLLQYPLWDYSQTNIKKLNFWGINNIQYVPVGYVPQMTCIPEINHQDIDVLFYGSINKRRQNIIDSLEAKGVKVKVLFGVYGQQRDHYISRAKIVLNLHFYEAQVFEIVRISYLLANRKFIISEKGCNAEEEKEFSSGLILANYNQLVDHCLYYLKQPQKREEIAQQGFKIMSQRSEKEYLKKVIPTINNKPNKNFQFIKDLYRKRQAKTCLELGQYQNAITLYEESIQVDSDCLENYWNLGLALLYDDDELAAQLTWFAVISEAEDEIKETRTKELLNFLEVTLNQQLQLKNLELAQKIEHQILEITT